MKQHVLLLACILVSSLHYSALGLPHHSEDQSTESRLRGDIERASSLAARRQYSQALQAYRQLVREHPNAPLADEAQVNIGDVLLRQNKHEQAIVEYQQLLDNNPPDRQGKSPLIVRARKGIFFALLQLGKYEEAEQFITSNLHRYDYPPEYIQQEMESRKATINRWKREAPEKALLGKLIQAYVQALQSHDLDKLRGICTSDISESRIRALVKHVQVNRIGTIELQDIQIQIGSSGNSAEATGVLLTGVPGQENLKTSGEFVYGFKKVGGLWRFARL